MEMQGMDMGMRELRKNRETKTLFAEVVCNIRIEKKGHNGEYVTWGWGVVDLQHDFQFG